MEGNKKGCGLFGVVRLSGNSNVLIYLMLLNRFSFLFFYINGIDTTRPVSIRVDSRPLDETLPQYGHRLQDHGPEYRTFETTCLYLFLVGSGRGEGCQLL